MRICRCACMAIALCLALASSGPALAEGCPDGSSNVANVTVSLDYGEKTITVTPSSVEIYQTASAGRPGEVCWLVENLKKGHTVHIVAKEGDSKPAGSTPGLLSKRQVLRPNNFAKSGSPSAPGEWHYLVRVTKGDPAVDVIPPLDPIVIIRGGGP